MGVVSPRLRWILCGVLAIAIAALALSFRGSDRPPVAAPELTIAGPTSAPGSTTPVSAPTPSSSSLYTPTAGDPAPVRPETARVLTVAAAEAVVRYFLGEAHNYLKATGDGRSVSEISHATCTPCDGEIERFGETNAANRRLSGDYLWREVAVRNVRRSGTRSMVVEVNARNGKHSAIVQPGAPATNFAGGPVSLVVTLVATGDNWSVFDVEAR